MSITIIVPARNEEENIFDSIKSLLDQSIKPQKIIIVLDRCTDNTENIVRELEKNNTEIITIVKDFTKYETFMKGFLVAEAINFALKHEKLSTDYLMIVNADTIFSNGYIKESLEIFEDDKRCGMVGYAHFSNVLGTGYLIRKNIFEELGNRMMECAAEDTHLQFSVLNLGYSIKKISNEKLTLLRERGEKSLGGQIKYEFGKGYAAYTLGFSFGYEIMRTGYWIGKGHLSSIGIIFGYIYAAFKKVKKLEIAGTHIVKEWQRKRKEEAFK